MSSLLSRPPWLSEEPELLKLLGTVLDRFDQQPGEARQRQLSFTAEKYLPSLRRLDAEADQLWRFVNDLQHRGVLDIKSGKRGPYDAEWKGARIAFLIQSEPLLRDWLQRPREEPALRTWRAAVQQYADDFPGDIAPLLKRRIGIPGLDDGQIVAALASLATLDTPHTLRQLSARIFRGDSKCLEDREDLIRTLFPALPLRSRPLVVAVHLPGQCRGVLFIENQDNYATAVAGGYPEAQGLAVVYAAGFRGGAVRIREPGAAMLHYSDSAGVRTDFEKWWFNRADIQPGPLHFFGDLDFAGMAILTALRQRFGDVIAWQPGYAPLLERLRNGDGHSPDAADKQQQSDPGSTGCPYADEVLLPAMRRFGFIDQEALV